MSTALPMLTPGASHEVPFVKWWRQHAPRQYADDDAMRELAATAFAAGQDASLPDADEIDELKQAIREARWALDNVSL